MDKQQISTLQLGILMFPTIMITAVLLVPALTSEIAGRDMWLSTIWAAFAGMLATYLAWKLHQYYQGKTIIQYVTNIIGSIPGKIIGMSYLFFYLHLTSLVLVQYAHFISGYFLNNTPMVVLTAFIVIACAFCVRSGIEVIARTSQLFTPLIFIFIVFIFLLLLPELDFRHLLPIMANGIYPSLKGAVIPIAWFSHFFLISFFLPYLKPNSKSLQSNIIAVWVIILALTITNLFTLLLFGESTSTYTYPVWSASRYISIGGFLEHMEALIMAVWIVGVFTKIAVFYYVTAIGTAQWFKLENYQPLVFPLGLIIILLSIWNYSTFDELYLFSVSIIPIYLPMFQIALPIILFIILIIKNKLKQGKGEKLDVQSYF